MPKMTFSKSYHIINANWQVEKILKEDVSYKCLSLIMLDSVIRPTKNYFPRTPKRKKKKERKEKKKE